MDAKKTAPHHQSSAAMTRLACSCCHSELVNMRRVGRRRLPGGGYREEKCRVHKVLHCMNSEKSRRVERSGAASRCCGMTWNRDKNSENLAARSSAASTANDWAAATASSQRCPRQAAPRGGLTGFNRMTRPLPCPRSPSRLWSPRTGLQLTSLGATTSWPR